MANRKNDRRGRSMWEKTTFDRARDELFSHIHRCQVLGATEEQQIEWMNDTIQYMAERYPTLTPQELEQLRVLGLRFCQPVINQLPNHTKEDANAA